MTSEERFKIILGEWLREKREKAGITQEEIAQRLGVSKQSIHYYEKGTNMMTAKAFVTYCRIVGADPNDAVKLL